MAPRRIAVPALRSWLAPDSSSEGALAPVLVSQAVHAQLSGHAAASVRQAVGPSAGHLAVTSLFSASPSRLEHGEHPAEAAVKVVDTFAVCFWGIVLVVCAAIILQRWQRRVQAEATGTAEARKPIKRSEVPQTMWALNVLAAIGQANIDFFRVALITVFMTVLQVFALFLVVHDINPNANPVTQQAASPWVQDVWTINCMKWLMTSFMSIQMVTEAGQFKEIYTAIFVTNRSRFEAPRELVMFVCSGQYIVIMFVVWGGVSSVLSFQAVPDILYSSMAIVFIATLDEAVYKMMHQLFDVDADFHILHCKRATGDNMFEALDTDGDGQVSQEEWLEALRGATHPEEAAQDDEESQKLKAEPLDEHVDTLLRVLAGFPVLLAFFLISRAFYTNVMPTDRLHALLRYLHAWRQG